MKNTDQFMDPIDRLEWAIHETAVNSGVPAAELAPGVGVKYRTFLNKSLPDQSDRFTIHQLALLVYRSKNPLIGNELLALAEREQPTEKLVPLILKMSKENGDIADVVTRALGDGMLTNREQAEIFKELDDLEQLIKSARRAVINRGSGVER